jgi:hypothetical protein
MLFAMPDGYASPVLSRRASTNRKRDPRRGRGLRRRRGRLPSRDQLFASGGGQGCSNHKLS